MCHSSSSCHNKQNLHITEHSRGTNRKINGRAGVVVLECSHPANFDRRSVAVKDVQEVLRQKELELSRVRRQIEALRLIIPVLAESTDQQTAHESDQRNRWPLQVDAPPRQSIG